MENEKIYRIMSIYEFYELCVNNKLKLSQIAIQNDKNDGIESFFQHMLLPYIHMVKSGAEEIFENTKKNRYITCWSKTKDSMAMWLLYSKNNDSIRVMTSKEKLNNALKSYSEEISMFTQWERPEEMIVSIKGLEKVSDVTYKDIRKQLNDLNDKFSSFKKEIESIDIESHNEYINKFQECFLSFNDKLRKNYRFDHFIKDQSFSFENEVRGEIHLAIKSDKYISKEDWLKKTEEDITKLPICDDVNRILPPVKYIKVPNDFIEEICFDPRMENYKKDILISLLNIDTSLISESKVFSPIVTQNIRLDPIKGIFYK